MKTKTMGRDWQAVTVLGTEITIRNKTWTEVYEEYGDVIKMDTLKYYREPQEKRVK